MRNIIILLLFLILSAMLPIQVSGKELKGNWTKIQYEPLAYYGDEWYVDVRATNISVMVAGYNVQVDGNTVVYEYFRDRPVIGRFSFFIVFTNPSDGNSSEIGVPMPEGDHIITIILLPSENSIVPLHYQEIYEFDLTIEKTLEGWEFIGTVLLYISPLLLILSYGFIVRRENKNKFHAINVLNAPLVWWRQWKATKFKTHTMKELNHLDKRVGKMRTLADGYIRERTMISWKEYMLKAVIGISVTILLIVAPYLLPEISLIGTPLPIDSISPDLPKIYLTHSFAIIPFIYAVAQYLNVRLIDQRRLKTYEFDDEDEIDEFADNVFNGVEEVLEYPVTKKSKEFLGNLTQEVFIIHEVREKMVEVINDLKNDKEDWEGKVQLIPPLFLDSETTKIVSKRRRKKEDKDIKTPEKTPTKSKKKAGKKAEVKI